MLTQLHKTLTAQNPQYGLFISAFDQDKNMILSEGSRSQPAHKILDTIYQQHIQNNTNISTIILHMVTTIENGSVQDLKNINLTTSGIGIHDNEGHQGAILPNTQGITTPQDALTALKSQAKLHGKAQIVIFTISDITFTIS